MTRVIRVTGISQISIPLLGKILGKVSKCECHPCMMNR